MPKKKSPPRKKVSKRAPQAKSKLPSTKAATFSKASKPTPSVGKGTDSKRVAAILQKLDEAYPDVTCALLHENPFQLLVSTILSAQCTDVRVNMVTPGLFKKYPTIESFAYANPGELEQDIRSTGFFRNKTKSIMGASKKLLDEFGSDGPKNDGRAPHARWRRTQNRQRCARHRVRNRERRRGGYARPASLRAARSHAQYRSEKNRTGFNGCDSARKMDSLLTPTYLAWSKNLPGPEAALR